MMKHPTPQCSSIERPIHGCLLLLALALSVPARAQEKTTAFTGARIHPVSSATIENGVLIIAGGKIQTVGDASTEIPEGAVTIDCKGKVITPGLIDTATTLGVSSTDQNEQGDEVTPHMKIVDAINADDKAFKRARQGGVTVVQISPGNKNVIGGLGAVLKTHGETVAEMLLKDESCLRVTMGTEPGRGNRAIRGGSPVGIYYRRPTTRMGVVWEVRRAFYAAMDYKDQQSDPDDKPDAAMEVLVRALDGKLQVRTTARAENDIRTALRLAQEFGYKTVLEEVTEAWLVADLLAASGTKLIVGAPSATSGHNDGAEGRMHTLNLLSDRSIPFAIATGSHTSALSLIDEATFAVRNGLDADQALTAITLVPAEILGVSDHVGTIEPTKDADLVIWNGPLFDPTTMASAVYVNGQEVSK